MNTVKKFLFIVQETEPFLDPSPFATLCRELVPKAMDSGAEARTFMPKWGLINERRNQLHEVIRLSGQNIIIDRTDHNLLIKVASVQGTRMQVYFIDNDEYFGKRGFHTDAKGVEYKDNPERATFFARGVIETVKKWGWVPDVVHCVGWVSAMMPFYIRKAFATEPAFRDCKIVYTPSGIDFTANMPKNLVGILSHRGATMDSLAKVGLCTMADFEKIGVYFSDIVAPFAPCEALLEFAEKHKKLIVPAPGKGENWTENYVAYVNRVWDETHPQKDDDDD